MIILADFTVGDVTHTPGQDLLRACAAAVPGGRDHRGVPGVGRRDTQNQIRRQAAGVHGRTAMVKNANRAFGLGLLWVGDDKEMGTVLHFRSIRLQSRGVKQFKRQGQS